jgi:hypothetical protein
MKWPAPVYFILVVLILSITFSNWAYDDPFITFRYAQNLVKGNGFVYNPGEHVLSTTTPLFTLILAFGGFFWSDFHRLALLAGAACLAASGLLFQDLAQSRGAPWVGLAGLLLVPTFPLLASTLSSEIPLYLALSIGAFAAYARKSYLLTGVLGALACLVRPDGVLVPILLAADLIILKKEKIPWNAILVFSAIGFLWMAFAWYYFGSPIPATLGAKQAQGRLAISEQFAPGFLNILREYASWPYFLLAGLALLGFGYAIWQKRNWVHFLIWPYLYFGAYAFLGVTRYFWYYAPLVPGIAGAAGLGLQRVRSWLQEPSKGSIARIGSALPAVLLLVLFLANSSRLLSMPGRGDKRYPIYRAAGEWINENTAPGDSVGSLEVGIIGYFAERPMVDFAGLIQPEIAARFRAETTYEDAAIWAVDEYSPGYLVLHDGLFPRLEEGFVAQNCSRAEKFEGSNYNYDWDLQIYDCRK